MFSHASVRQSFCTHVTITHGALGRGPTPLRDNRHGTPSQDLFT